MFYKSTSKCTQSRMPRYDQKITYLEKDEKTVVTMKHCDTKNSLKSFVDICFKDNMG